MVNEMFSTSDIRTLSDFNRRPGEHIKRLKDTGRPEVLTQNGRPALVIQDAAAYEEMARKADYADTVLNLRQALRDFADGKGQDIETALAALDKRLQAKHGRPDLPD